MKENHIHHPGNMVMTPTIGLRFTHPTLGNVIVIAVHPLGTIDVRNIWTDRCYRISGLPMTGGVK